MRGLVKAIPQKPPDEEQGVYRNPAKSPRQMYLSAVSELSSSRTHALPRFTEKNGSAEIFVVIARDSKWNGGRIEEVRFVADEELLPGVGDALRAATIPDRFPRESNPRIIRRGFVSCGASSGCAVTFMNAGDVRSLE